MVTRARSGEGSAAHAHVSAFQVPRVHPPAHGSHSGVQVGSTAQAGPEEPPPDEEEPDEEEPGTEDAPDPDDDTPFEDDEEPGPVEPPVLLDVEDAAVPVLAAEPLDTVEPEEVPAEPAPDDPVVVPGSSVEPLEHPKRTATPITQHTPLRTMATGIAQRAPERTPPTGGRAHRGSRRQAKASPALGPVNGQRKV
jgi:hypothetical protein